MIKNVTTLAGIRLLFLDPKKTIKNDTPSNADATEIKVALVVEKYLVKYKLT